MFGLTTPQINSMVDKKIAGVVKPFRQKLHGAATCHNSLKGRVTVLENKVTDLETNNSMLFNKLVKLEEYLKIEFVDEKVVGYKKITKSKK